MTTIVRVIKVVDTRKWTSGPGGTFPIPGTGTMNECRRCGARHEIHAHVELSDGTVAIMGDTCAAREASHLGAVVKDARSLTLSIARARAKLAAIERLADEWRRYEEMIRGEHGLRSYDRIPPGLYYELRDRTAEHFGAKGMARWYMPPSRGELAKAQKAVARLLEQAGGHRA